MPTDDLLNALLKFSRKRISDIEWQKALMVHRVISTCSFDYLMALLYLLFPLDGTCSDASKSLYRRLFLVSHILEILSTYESIADVACRFAHLRKIFEGRTVLVQVLADASKNYTNKEGGEKSLTKTTTNLFIHIMDVFNLHGMQQSSTYFTLERAILTDLIEPPKLSLFSPWLSAVLHYQLSTVK